jgi:hypothetical protein
VTPQDRALIMVYESVKHRLTIGLVEYLEAVKDWTVIPLTESGRVIGGVLVKDNEIHVGYGVKPIKSIRAYIRSVLGGVIDKHGFAITTVQAENLAGLRFCERLGFVKLSANDGKILLRCDRSNYL